MMVYNSKYIPSLIILTFSQIAAWFSFVITAILSIVYSILLSVTGQFLLHPICLFLNRDFLLI